MYVMCYCTSCIIFSLIIATPHHPMPITMATINLLAPSRPFVVYHQFLEVVHYSTIIYTLLLLIQPLVMTYQSLKTSGKVFNLQLSETMLRYYQVNILINAHHYNITHTGVTG